MLRISKIFFLFTFVMLFSLSWNNAESTNMNNTSNLETVIKLHDTIFPSDTSAGKDYLKIGFELIEKESLGEIKLGLSSIQVIELLGKPDKKTKPALWGADGEYHQTWSYTKKGIELDLIGENETKLTINMITITKPCNLKTKRLIGIGSDIENVRTVYNEEIDPLIPYEKSIVAGSIYGGIIFEIENNKVKSIFIGAAAE
jgi:hypothetical protein